MLKLVFVSFGLLLFIGCKWNAEKPFTPIENRLVADECVGYVLLDSIDQQLKTSTLSSISPWLNMFSIRAFLLNSGIKNTRVYFSANLESQSARAFVQISDTVLFDTRLAELTEIYQLRKENIAKENVICLDRFNMKAVRVDSVLMFTYNLLIEDELLAFKAQNYFDTAWTEVIQKKGQPFYSKLQNQKLTDFSIENISATAKVDSSLHVSVLINKLPQFPFQFAPAFRTFSSTESTFSVDLLLEKQRLNRHNKWRNYLATLGRKIGFPTTHFFDAWEGEFHFAKGGVDIERNIEIVTVLDENFNTVERKKIKETQVEALQLMFNLNSTQDALFLEMKETGFLNKEKDRYNFFIAPPLSLLKVQNIHSFYSGSKVPTLSSVKTNRVLALKTEKGTLTINLVLDNEFQSVYEVLVDIKSGLINELSDLSLTR